jgi:hypothetical protein
MDWSDLQNPGKNGFLLIVISLTWWGKASTREGSWLEAVVNITEVLLCMHRAPERFEAPKANLLMRPGCLSDYGVCQNPPPSVGALDAWTLRKLGMS